MSAFYEGIHGPVGTKPQEDNKQASNMEREEVDRSYQSASTSLAEDGHGWKNPRSDVQKKLAPARCSGRFL